MTTAGWHGLWLALACACGRIGFDPLGTASCVMSEAVDRACLARPASVARGYPGHDVWFALNETMPRNGIHDFANKYTARCTGTGPEPCPLPVSGAQEQGNGLKFSGQQLQISGLPDGHAAYTVAVWARLDEFPRGANPFSCTVSRPNNAAIPALPQDDGNSYALCVEPQHRTYVFTTSDTQGDSLFAADGFGEIASTGEWHHLATTWDAACRTQVLYFDGCRVNASTGLDVRFDPGDVFVGADNFGTTSPDPTYFWNGVLDDLVIYYRALDDTEIQGLVGK